jgi:hypothetical protein
MVLISILLCVLIGACVIRTVHQSPNLAECVGLSFPVGLFVQTVLMIILDACNVAITPLSLLPLDAFLLLALGYYLLVRKGLRLNHSLLFWQNTFKQVKSINLVWLLLMGFVVWFEYQNLERSLFFPTYDRDSLVGFDTIGFVLSREHTFKGLSLFDAAYFPDIRQAGSYISYAPFVQLAYGYIYLFGAETSKLIPALMFLSLLIGFYAVLTRSIGKTGAALGTLLLLLTPQLLAFSSQSSTNVIHALFASLGIIYGLMWFNSRQQGDLFISALLLGAGVWTRSEGIIFVVALGVALLVDSIRKSSYKRLIAWSVITLIPFVGWFVFQRLFNLQSENIIITQPFWDGDKMGFIWSKLLEHFLHAEFYGWTFFVMFFSLLLNAWFLIKQQNNLTPLLVLLGCVFLYGMTLYHIDYVWDSIDNVMDFSAKRFIFCFVPIAWYYSLTNKISADFLRRIDGWLDLSRVRY